MEFLKRNNFAMSAEYLFEKKNIYSLFIYDNLLSKQPFHDCVGDSKLFILWHVGLIALKNRIVVTLYRRQIILYLYVVAGIWFAYFYILSAKIRKSNTINVSIRLHPKFITFRISKNQRKHIHFGFAFIFCTYFS